VEEDDRQMTQFDLENNERGGLSGKTPSVSARNGADAYNLRLVDVVFKSRVTELEADDIQQPISMLLRILVVLDPVLHRHLETFLRVHVHYVKNAS